MANLLRSINGSAGNQNLSINIYPKVLWTRIYQQQAYDLDRETQHSRRIPPTRKPQQNAYIECYNCTIRGEWLAQNIFESTVEAQEQATEWRWTYNNDRPNMSIGGITPARNLIMAA